MRIEPQADHPSKPSLKGRMSTQPSRRPPALLGCHRPACRLTAVGFASGLIVLAAKEQNDYRSSTSLSFSTCCRFFALSIRRMLASFH
jgi:hypothetical protein